MQELVTWFRIEREKPDVNPIVLATLFHYRFIRIHPFDDGNGRVARILMNFILMQFGYPPVIIKTEDKENYYAVLRLADADELEPFVEYITLNLVRSLQIMIWGARGETIEEPDDLDKELVLLGRRLETSGRSIQVDRSPKNVANAFDLSIRPLLDRVKTACEKFDRFYASKRMLLEIDGRETEIVKFQSFLGLQEDIWFYKNTENITFTYYHNTLKQAGFEKVYYVTEIDILFDLNKYRVRINLGKSAIELLTLDKNYPEIIPEVEIDEICRTIVLEHKKFIESVLVSNPSN